MRILFLSGMLPHSRVVSGFVVVYQRMKLLAERGHEIGLASFAGTEELRNVHEIKPMLYEMELVSIPQARAGALRRIESFLSPIPAAFRELTSEQMRAVVGRMVERSRYDVVIAEFSPMGQYLYRNPHLPAVRRIISCHSCYTSAARGRIGVQGFRAARSLITQLQLPKLQRYEFDMYRSVDHVVTLTPEESVDLHHYAPELKISVSPYGVDLEAYKPRPDIEQENAIVYTGFFRDYANCDAILWFVENVWPGLRERFPDLKFYIAGRDPSRHILSLAAKDPRIRVTGEVANLADYLNRSRVYVCPVRIGKGLRGKILQAMAAGIPVVSTSLGAEGITAQSGHSIMLADTAHTMTESVSLLLREEGLRRKIAANARNLAVSRYSWERCVSLLEDVLRKVTEQPSQ